jgi:ABC-type lipoprotein release transport system permease subunit
MVNTQQAVVMTAVGLAVIALVAVVIVLTSAHLETSGTIVTNNPNLSIFADAACTKEISTVQWGTLQPSGSATVTLFIKNSGNVPLTLTMTANNWSPATAQNYLTLSWNQENTKVQPGAVVAGDLTLKVAPLVADLTDFAFQITVNGDGNK